MAAAEIQEVCEIYKFFTSKSLEKEQVTEENFFDSQLLLLHVFLSVSKDNKRLQFQRRSWKVSRGV